jgi:hypothetical protein
VGVGDHVPPKKDEMGQKEERVRRLAVVVAAAELYSFQHSDVQAVQEAKMDEY